MNIGWKNTKINSLMLFLNGAFTAQTGGSCYQSDPDLSLYNARLSEAMSG